MTDPHEDDLEEPSREDIEQFGEDSPSGVKLCPNCGAEVYEDTVRCPICREYITPATPDTWPLWFKLLGLLGVIAVVIMLAQLYLIPWFSGGAR